MVRATVVRQGLICDRCGGEVYACGACKNYFEEFENIDCQMDYHYCESCQEEESE